MARTGLGTSAPLEVGSSQLEVGSLQRAILTRLEGLRKEPRGEEHRVATRQCDEAAAALLPDLGLVAAGVYLLHTQQPCFRARGVMKRELLLTHWLEGRSAEQKAHGRTLRHSKAALHTFEPVPFIPSPVPGGWGRNVHGKLLLGSTSVFQWVVVYLSLQPSQTRHHGMWAVVGGRA